MLHCQKDENQVINFGQKTHQVIEVDFLTVELR